MIGDSLEKIYTEFEKVETGSAKKLKLFIGKAANNYKIPIDELVYRPGISLLELVTPNTIKN